MTVDPPLRPARRSAAKRPSRCSSRRSSPPPRMVIFGAVDFTAALATCAKLLGFRSPSATPGPSSRPCTISDGRRGRRRMAGPVPRRDRPQPRPNATSCAYSPTTPSSTCPPSSPRTRTRAGYIGAMGSAAPTKLGWRGYVMPDSPTTSIERVMSPIGLDIGARTPEETAIAICAEIIAARTGRRAASLRDTAGPIH